MRQDTGDTLEVFRLELLRRANTHGDQRLGERSYRAWKKPSWPGFMTIHAAKHRVACRAKGTSSR